MCNSTAILLECKMRSNFMLIPQKTMLPIACLLPWLRLCYAVTLFSGITILVRGSPLPIATPASTPLRALSTNPHTIINSDADWIAPSVRISPTTSCGIGRPTCKVNINDSDHSYFGMWNDSPQANRNLLLDQFYPGESNVVHGSLHSLLSTRKS